MNFLIQGEKGLPFYDFGFELIQNIKYQKELSNAKREYIVSLSKEDIDGPMEEWCPVGSVEFVLDYLDYHGIVKPKPINIPEELRLMSGLRPMIVKGNTTFKNSRFVKSIEEIKHPMNGFMNKSPDIEGLWQATDVVDFVSEWRCFIFGDRLIDCKNYLGDFERPPSKSYIKDCISMYRSAPIAYTLDVGVIETRSCVIEVHDFFSCGLYGFSAPHIYPQMLSQWYYNYLHPKRNHL